MLCIIHFQIIPIMISICMMGFKNRNVSDYIKMFHLQTHESHWFFKIVFTQISIYVSLFFTMLVICGLLIKEQVPKKLVSKKKYIIIFIQITTIRVEWKPYKLLINHKLLESIDINASNRHKYLYCYLLYIVNIFTYCKKHYER